MKINLESYALAQSSASHPIQKSRITSLAEHIPSFTCDSQECNFDADFQAPLGVAGKTHKMGRELLLLQKV